MVKKILQKFAIVGREAPGFFFYKFRDSWLGGSLKKLIFHEVPDFFEKKKCQEIIEQIF